MANCRYCGTNCPENGEHDRFFDCQLYTDRRPTIDAALVVHGKWIKDGPYRAVSGNYNKSVTCSVCNSLFISNGNEPWALHPFCCECGAKMEDNP